MPTLTRRTWARLALTTSAALTLPRATGAQTPAAPRVPNGRRYLQYDVFTGTPLTAIRWAGRAASTSRSMWPAKKSHASAWEARVCWWERVY